MTSSEKFYLKWIDYQKNVSTTFNESWQDTEFTDMTPACEGGQLIEVHRVILVASSPLLRKNTKKM